MPFLIWAGHYFESRISRIFDGIGEIRNILFAILGIFILITLGKTLRKLFFGNFIFSKEKKEPGYTKHWFPWLHTKR